jgi:hypothetical protein
LTVLAGDDADAVVPGQRRALLSWLAAALPTQSLAAARWAATHGQAWETLAGAARELGVVWPEIAGRQVAGA